MKKVLVAIAVLTLSVLMATSLFAQDNKLAFFAIDSDLATVGFQGGVSMMGIGGGDRVGFAVYVKNVDQLRTVSLDVTWDGTKAEMAGEAGYGVDIDDRTVNGASLSVSEDNALGDVSGIVNVDDAGQYTEDFAKLGGDALASSDYALVYCVVLRTVSGFTTDDSFAVNVGVKVLNDTGAEKDLGMRQFYVNGSVDVKTSTWGEIKSQFKD